jgi:hypothetical protein
MFYRQQFGASSERIVLTMIFISYVLLHVSMYLHHFRETYFLYAKVTKSANQQIKMFIQVTVRDTLKMKQMRRNTLQYLQYKIHYIYIYIYMCVCVCLHWLVYLIN